MKILQKKTTEDDIMLASLMINNDMKLPQGAILKGSAIVEVSPYKQEVLLLYNYDNKEYVYRINSCSDYDEFILI